MQSVRVLQAGPCSPGSRGVRFLGRAGVPEPHAVDASDRQRKLSPSERPDAPLSPADVVFAEHAAAGASRCPADMPDPHCDGTGEEEGIHTHCPACAGGLPPTLGPQRQDIIVVATLLDKAPNLGGLARTCEVGMQHSDARHPLLHLSSLYCAPAHILLLRQVLI